MSNVAEDQDTKGRDPNRIIGATARDVVEFIAKSLSDQPDTVDVYLDENSPNDVTIRVHADSRDLGRIIGKRGHVIQSIRQIARAAGAQEEVSVNVEIEE